MRWCEYLCCYCRCFPCCKDNHTQPPSSETAELLNSTSPQKKADDTSVFLVQDVSAAVQNNNNPLDETDTRNRVKDSGGVSATDGSPTSVNDVQPSGNSGDVEKSVLNNLTSADHSDQPPIAQREGNSSGVSDKQSE